MPRIYIDLETRGTIDLKLCGVHVYAAHPDTEILMMAYKIENGPVQVWWPGRDQALPAAIWESGWTVVSHNAPFERAMWREKIYCTPDVPLANWEDTAARAAMCGLPRSLDGVTKALGLAHTKDDEGYRLMLQMCKPKRLSKKELLALAAELNMPAEQAEAEMKFILDRLKVDPEAPGYLRRDYRRFYKWKEDEASLQRLAEYCKADVMAEYELDKVLPTMPARERRVWELDQKINDRGVKVDVSAAKNAIALIAKHEDTLTQELQALTGGAVKTAKQSAALAHYLGSENVTKQTICDTLLTEEDPVKRRVMEIRQSLGQSSVAKFQALLQATGSDGRMRGMFMYHGAATGRWCLAEDTEVLVLDINRKIYYRKIQDVRDTDKLWDGREWVTHDGVVFSGEKEVVGWHGVRATREHNVYVSDDTCVPLAAALEQKIPLYMGEPWDTVFT